MFPVGSNVTPDGESASERIDRYLRNEISYTELIDYGIPDFYFDKTGDSITIVPSLLRTTMVIVHQILRFAIPSRFLQNANFKDHNGKQKNILTIFKELKYDFTNMIATFSNFMVQQLFVIMNDSINKKKQTSLLNHAQQISKTINDMDKLLLHPELRDIPFI